jgi:hypothetical protein
MELSRILKIAAAIAFVAFVLNGCSEEGATRKVAEIEMRELTGEWSPVISVHGYYDNDAAADEVMRGLKLVSKVDGHESREYRIRP